MTGLRRQGTFTIVPEPLVRDLSVTVTAFRLWCLLDRFAGPADASMPTRKELAAAIGRGTDAVDDAIRCLETTGWLTVERQAGTASCYVLNETPTAAEGGRENPAPDVLSGRENPAGGAASTPTVPTPLPTSSEKKSYRTSRLASPVGEPELFTPVDDPVEKPLTLNQRVNAIGRRVCDDMPRANALGWHVVRESVFRACSLGEFDDEAVEAALRSCMENRRPLSPQVLIVECERRAGIGGTFPTRQQQAADRTRQIGLDVMRRAAERGLTIEGEPVREEWIS